MGSNFQRTERAVKPNDTDLFRHSYYATLGNAENFVGTRGADGPVWLTDLSTGRV